MEMARVDSSVATFWGVHSGLSAGSIYLCGRRPIGDGRKRRTADARYVEDDGRPIVQGMKKRFSELPIRANSVEQQQGRPLFWSAHRRDTDRLAADQDRSNVDAIFPRTVVHGRKLQGTTRRRSSGGCHQ
jgi:hypothetical protein